MSRLYCSFVAVVVVLLFFLVLDFSDYFGCPVLQYNIDTLS